MIEIRNAYFINKGAELMVYAIAEMVRSRKSDADLVMAPRLKEPEFVKRATLGLYQKLWIESINCGIYFSFFGGLIPKKIRKMYGMVKDSEIEVVLDASGFAYSDQMGKRCRATAKAIKNWKKRGTKVVLLPQAFGPFERGSNKGDFRVIADNADLIFVRDKISYEYVVDLVGERQNIKMAPDFTNLLEGKIPENFDFNNNRFCIIPNSKMIEKTSPEESKGYLPFLVQCTEYLNEKGGKPFILIHEGKEDLRIGQEIARRVKGDIPVIIESNPLHIKGIIGASNGTIGSRFHGLVSALSQGVPAFATGWSHKYKMLFEDYDFLYGLMPVDTCREEVNSKIDVILDGQKAKEIKKTLLRSSERQKKMSQNMWDEVFRVIF